VTNKTSHWYAIYTKPRWEKKVYKLLTDKNIEAYCPINKIRKKWSDRMKIVDEPLFKSYIFARVTHEQQSQVRMTAGVVNFVYWQGKPAIIPIKEIETVRKFLNEYQHVLVEPIQLKEEGRVTIRQGLFMDQEARIIKIEGNKVKVVIESIGYTLVASMDKKNLSTLIH
jgi:transcription antitermination factor NusG